MRFRETFQIDPGIRDLASFSAEACAKKFNLPAPRVRFYLPHEQGQYEVPHCATAFLHESCLWVRANLSEGGVVERVSAAMYRAHLKRQSGGNIDDMSIMSQIDNFGHREGLAELRCWLDTEITACSKSK